ncbi:SDR family NAD(P)-dependent oxidoreductase [Rhizorhabdus wittichii]|uniref:SDR family NAD(P)-dependent oxidoreductase n=1 Tax=Rhizorhabdus wittichii TaxID=160791 RepID=UPI00037B50DA|nr:SDR family oxidoreductase [Rhizorhabdus wittichii]
MDNKIALVVGAAGGIGKAIALRFAREGATVIATGTSGREKDLAALAPTGSLTPLHCDIAEADGPEQAVATVDARFGRLDLVVNNAGIGLPRKRLHEIDLDEWQRLMDVNLRGTFLMMKAALPRMIRSGGGSYINIGSTGAYRASALAAPYCASKGGILQLTRAAALEYVEDKVRVNAICPGTVRTPLLDRHPPEFLDQLAARIPMGRLAEPDDIASLAVFLGSDEASYITGQGYVIDGGRFAG